MKILWICFVWPEPVSSAAGVRTRQLLDACVGAGHEVHVCSPCQDNSYAMELRESGIPNTRFEPNNPAIDSFLTSYAPDVVFFDRFMIEEQFGWRVRQQCPAAIRVLDTIDLHSLRRMRHEKVKRGENPLSVSHADLLSEVAAREISSILRSDLSLIISDAEIRFLTERYAVAPELLLLNRFSYELPEHIVPFEERKNFVIIGNFNHAPNADSVKLLHAELWDSIRGAVNGESPELHVYGAYPSDEFLKLDNEKKGFRVKGWTKDSLETLSRYRVNLAPLRFGAGIKGKISDGWAVGTPCAGTSIAAEGLHEDLEFGGIIEDSFREFATKAADLYSNKPFWECSQRNGSNIIRTLFSPARNTARFLQGIETAVLNRDVNRASNFKGYMLWQQQNRSTEYFSRWIEVKNKLSSITHS